MDDSWNNHCHAFTWTKTPTRSCPKPTVKSFTATALIGQFGSKQPRSMFELGGQFQSKVRRACRWAG